MSDTKRNSTPKIIFTCRYRLALTNPDNKVSSSFHEKNMIKDIKRMTNYYRDPKKEIVSMIDYYRGSKQDKIVNLVLEDGHYATENELQKFQIQMSNAIKNSNLYKGVVSFDSDWLIKAINIRELEKIIAKEVMPKFLRKCGFVDMKKMRYCFSFHGNTNHIHLHMAFVETAPNHINRDGKILYRRKGKITSDEKNFFKNELLISIERHKVMRPLLMEVNQEMDEFKKNFDVQDKNFILKNISDIKLEEKIVKLGFLVSEYRKDNKFKKVKYGSIKNNAIGKEIKKITKEIKEELFRNKDSELYKQQLNVQNSLNKLTDYYKILNKENHIEEKVKNNKLVLDKQKYIESYVLNAIVNHALFRCNRLQNIVKTKNTKDCITLDDLLQELAYEKSRIYKNKNLKLLILQNYFNTSVNTKKVFLKQEVINAVKNLNREIDESAKEFHQLFVNDDYKR